MIWLRKLGNLVNILFRTNGHRERIDMPDDNKEISREDSKLSDHFSLFELTATSTANLQEVNRMLSNNQLKKLKELAAHCELMRSICGAPVVIHSGYRSVLLNGVVKGSASTSQHPRCEAVDFHASGQAVEETFEKLLEAARQQKFKFGQLIIERADRGYSTVQWIHCSVIGTLDPAKVGQVMKMVAGLDGKPHYILIDHLKFSE